MSAGSGNSWLSFITIFLVHFVVKSDGETTNVNARVPNVLKYVCMYVCMYVQYTCVSQSVPDTSFEALKLSAAVAMASSGSTTAYTAANSCFRLHLIFHCN